MRSVIPFNDNWLFHEGCADHLLTAIAPGDTVRLPHTAVELPFAYFDEGSYQRPFTYQRVVRTDPAWEGQEVNVVFDGAMADARVYLNGELLVSHEDGYTPFSARLTGKLRPGDNLLTIRIDGSENPQIPPFGGRIDYLTYAGIYRDAWLKITPPVSIGTVKIETPEPLANRKSIRAHIELDNPSGAAIGGTIKVALLNAAGERVASTSLAAAAKVTATLSDLEGIELWDIESPVLYTLEVSLGEDRSISTFGFRDAQFTPEGFRLNGRPLKLRGLNRHQSFPYAGYALGRTAQERDAEILKRQLHVNLVRTSHYPQSPWFLEACDRLGLLVFEEIPGWQHIGAAAWQDESVENVRRMIRRDWNHPSIIMWGVRINESQDSHDFYVRTNAAARELDATRPTGGVRYITDSEFLEDVFTQNDFILGNEELGGNRPRTALRPVAETTGLDRPVPYLVTEFNGHMYPTKSYDQEQRQAEHVLRHLQILDAAYGDPSISGAIGWCAFDYNTHKDFGSGDRICHHGVMDMFREPKFAAYAYASQCEPDEEVVLAPVTFWARGERNIGGVLPLIVLTNCDAVELQYGDAPPKRFIPDRAHFPHLPHAPVVIEREDFTAAELGLWGMKWEHGTINGFLGGRVVKSVRFAADPVATRLEVAVDADDVLRGESMRVMVRPLDQLGNKLPFLFEPVSIDVGGAGTLIGPTQVSLRGGHTGFWVRAADQAGRISVTVSSPRFGATTIGLFVR